MLLFFTVSMVAAYTSRSLIFEQRTSANQYRATQALEAGEAAIEWTLAQLNAGRMVQADPNGGPNNSCTASANESEDADPSFRERYLTISATTGNITPRLANASSGGSVTPVCVFQGSSITATDWRWNCRCPFANPSSESQVTPTLEAPTTPGPAPAFTLLLRRTPTSLARPDIVILDVASCTKLDTSPSGCVNLDNPDPGGTGNGVARISTRLALRGALTRVPAGALTLADTITAIPAGTTLAVKNSDATANGITLHLGGAPPPMSGLALAGLPGSVASSTMVVSDPGLRPADLSTVNPPTQPLYNSSDRSFSLFFGLHPDNYVRQPGLPVIDCNGGCNSNQVRRALTLNPGRPVWLKGTGGTFNLDGEVGTTDRPALLIVEGDVTINSDAAFTGLLYGRKQTWLWSAAGTSRIVGAAVGEGSLQTAGSGFSISVTYNAAVLKALRVSQGTFVRVPGSWRDF